MQRLEDLAGETKTKIDNITVFTDSRQKDNKREIAKVYEMADGMVEQKEFKELSNNYISLKANLESDLD